jgi:hypothetical protein
MQAFVKRYNRLRNSSKQLATGKLFLLKQSSALLDCSFDNLAQAKADAQTR